MRLLIVEDHAPLAANIGEYLTDNGWSVDFATDGMMALRLATANPYDVLVLDLGLPKIDGMTLCHRLRQRADVATPILMLTARDTLQDKIDGFNAGADDYLTKPFELAELRVRLTALIRRAAGKAYVLRIADLIFDTGTLAVERAGHSIRLSPTGLRVLEILMRRAPNVVTRKEIAYQIWGDDPPDSEASLRVHIHCLRTAIDKPYGSPLVHTIARIGYRIAADYVA